MPESDRVWESDVEEEEAEEEDIVTILVREAEEPLPDIQELEEGWVALLDYPDFSDLSKICFVTPLIS